MNNKVWSLFLPLMLGVVNLQAGWVYQADEPYTNELSDEEEDLSETLGLIEEDLDEENLLASEEKSLPWGSELSSKDYFSLLEEHTRAKQTDLDQEDLALEIPNDDFTAEDYFPSMEGIPSKEKSFLAERSKEEDSRDRRKVKILDDREVALKKAPKKPQASTKKKALTVQSKRPAANNRGQRSPSKTQGTIKKRPLLKEKKGALLNRQKKEKFFK